MYPKQFIQQVFITEFEKLTETNPYITFALMGIGIEFLGKCLDVNQKDWNKGGSEKNFNKAIDTLNSFKKYRTPIRVKYKLWDSLRNGFAHSFVPKKHLGLSSKNEMKHMIEYEQNGTPKINLRCEDLYVDFKGACIEVINKDFTIHINNKMNRQLLSVPS